jgi:thiol-disulfide isomerase/thioredoxin
MKTRMRRPCESSIVALLITSIMVVAVVACGSDTQSDTSSAGKNPAAETETQSGAPAAETKSIGLPDSFESETFKGFGNIKGFAGTTFSHGTFDTREHEGKPLVVNFWFPSCPPCRAELQDIEKVYQKFGDPGSGEVVFVGVQQLGIDTIEDGAALFEELGITFPSLPDQASGIQIGYNVFSYPSTIFLDKNHNRYRVWQGAINEEEMTEIVAEIAGGATAQIEGEVEPSEGETVAVMLADDVSSDVETEVAMAETVYTATQTFIGFGDAPGFKGDTFHHGPFDLNRHEGKPVVINFWFPSCPPCRAEIPNFEHAYQTWGAPGKDQVVFVGVQAVGFDTAADGVEFLGQMKATYPAIPDVGNAIHFAYQITAAPMTFFLDRRHNVLSVHHGYLKHKQLQDILVQLVET